MKRIFAALSILALLGLAACNDSSDSTGGSAQVDGSTTEAQPDATKKDTTTE